MDLVWNCLGLDLKRAWSPLGLLGIKQRGPEIYKSEIQGEHRKGMTAATRQRESIASLHACVLRVKGFLGSKEAGTRGHTKQWHSMRYKTDENRA